MLWVRDCFIYISAITNPQAHTLSGLERTHYISFLFSLQKCHTCNTSCKSTGYAWHYGGKCGKRLADLTFTITNHTLFQHKTALLLINKSTVSPQEKYRFSTREVPFLHQRSAVSPPEKCRFSDGSAPWNNAECAQYSPISLHLWPTFSIFACFL